MLLTATLCRRNAGNAGLQHNGGPPLLTLSNERDLRGPYGGSARPAPRRGSWLDKVMRSMEHVEPSRTADRIGYRSTLPRRLRWKEHEIDLRIWAGSITVRGSICSPRLLKKKLDRKDP